MRDALLVGGGRMVLPGDDDVDRVGRINLHIQLAMGLQVEGDRDDVAVAAVDRDVEIAHGDLLRPVHLLPLREKRHDASLAGHPRHG